jgi:hypothetical protein
VTVTIAARGGSGGNGGFGADGSKGVAVSLDNAASDSTTGQLTLTQNAYGGAGGEAVFNPANVGRPASGSASSILDIHDMAAANVSATAYANGGSGGSNENGSVAGAAGSTTASTTLVGDCASGAIVFRSMVSTWPMSFSFERADLLTTAGFKVGIQD